MALNADWLAVWMCYSIRCRLRGSACSTVMKQPRDGRSRGVHNLALALVPFTSAKQHIQWYWIIASLWIAFYFGFMFLPWTQSSNLSRWDSRGSPISPMIPNPCLRSHMSIWTLQIQPCDRIVSLSSIQNADCVLHCHEAAARIFQGMVVPHHAHHAADSTWKPTLSWHNDSNTSNPNIASSPWPGNPYWGALQVGWILRRCAFSRRVYPTLVRNKSVPTWSVVPCILIRISTYP